MAGIYGSNSSGAASPYGAPTARLDMPNRQPEMNRPGVPQGPSYGGMPRPGKPQGPAYGQNPQALAALLSKMAPQMGSQAMPDGSMMPNSAMPAPVSAPMPPIPAQMPMMGKMPAPLGAPVGSPMMPSMPTAMPMMGNPDPMAAQRLRDRQMAGVMQ